MKSIKIYLLVLVLNLCCFAQAQTLKKESETEKRHFVRQIVDKLNYDRLLSQRFAGLVSMFQKQAPIIVAQAGIPIYQQDQASKILISEIFASEEQLRKLAKENIINGYMSTFSIEELKELMAFYDTPVGQKLASAVPRLEAEANRRMTTEGDELATKTICTAIKRFKSEGIQSATPAFCQ